MEFDGQYQAEMAELVRKLEAVTASEARLRTMIENIPTFVWCGLPDGSTEFISQRWSEYTGLPAESTLGWGWQAAIHPDDLLRVIEELKMLEVSARPGEIEARLRRSDGVFRWFVCRLEPLLDEHGKLTRWYSSCLDIEDQKQAEDRLQRSERNLAEGQRLTKTGSWVLDLPTGNTDWSVETCRIFGFPDPPPSPHYQEFLERVRPEDRDAVNRGLEESFEKEEPRPLQYVFVLPDGTEKNIETISQPIRDATGKLMLMGTVMDVTERVENEKSLRASEILARGQFNALARALEVLARESDPERLLEHFLRTVADELGAHGGSVWRRVEGTDRVEFEFSLEEGQFLTKADVGMTTIVPTMAIDDVWPWPEVFQDGKPHVLDDIREGPHFPWRDHVLALGVVTILIVPMLIGGEVEGVIGIRFRTKRTFSAGEIDLAQALANQAMLAIQVTRLSALNRETAVIAERNRMARDIHDTVAQTLTGIVVQLEAAEESSARGNDASPNLGRARELARMGLREARASVRALRPHAENPLAVALPALISRMTSGTGVSGSFSVKGNPRRLPADFEEHLLRIGQEALTNSLRHAKATRFDVRVEFNANRVELELSDDGCGFCMQERHEGFGLVGMRERIGFLRGRLNLESAPGAGTRILISVPTTAD